MLALVVAAMVCTTRAEAFCVYNKSDVAINVVQTKGQSSMKGVQWKIDPGENKCCNWKTKDCNKSQKKTSKVEFKVSYTLPWSGGSWGSPSNKIFCTKKIKAGGWLTIKGKSPDFSCRPHY